QYDTIIVDEAHERSLNIDFLLGYLKRLLPRRPDLKVIITSATIDAERFAEHFGTAGHPAPILTVEGRTYPVEIFYRPLAEEGEIDESSDSDVTGDWLDAVAGAVGEVAELDQGHILVFLPTERDIRDAERRLAGRRYPGDTASQPTQIVPLFGRLSMADQTRVFQPSPHRRIVLATNVAESSLTVPDIRYVIDVGTARISRYSARSRVQRLPIEPVSQASARQRAGRCGRVGPGVCIRLYSEADFLARDEFTAPEIQRTNLASVILRTVSLGLGDIEQFPFLDPPRPTSVREGFRTLQELGALTENGGLAETGRRMSRLPVDPRISRIILAAIDEQCLEEVLIIAAALEIQDPRDRPLEKQQAADQAHQQFRHEDSDFLTLLNLWDAWQENSRKLSGNRLRKWCQQNFLSWLRMREWGDIHRQLRELLTDGGDKEWRHTIQTLLKQTRRNDYAAIHRSLMTGFLSGLATITPEGDYLGASGNRLLLWPGSTLSGKKPRWIVAAELVETSRRYARVVARIQPEWIEPIADHLVRRDYSEPHWAADAGNVMVFEKVSLWGLPIVPRRRIPYARIDAVKSREMLIQHGLVEQGLLHGTTDPDAVNAFEEEQEALTAGRQARVTPGRARSGSSGWGSDFPFLTHNHAVMEELRELQARSRRFDLVPSDESVFEFYETRIPAECVDRQRLRRWYQRTIGRDPRILNMEVAQFVNRDTQDEHTADFPDEALFGQMTLPLTYQLDPGTQADGVTVSVPVEAIGQLTEVRLSWLVPGLLEQRVLALIRSLPKARRVHFVPAPDSAAAVCRTLTFAKGDLTAAMAARLSEMSGERIEARMFDAAAVPDHLKFNIRVVSHEGTVLADHRDLHGLRMKLSQSAEQTSPEARAVEEEQWHRTGFRSWEFADIPRSITILRAGMAIHAFPAVTDQQDSVALTLCMTADQAAAELRRGLRRLFLLTDAKRIRAIVDTLPGIQQVRMHAAVLKKADINSQLQLLVADRAYLPGNELPRCRAVFETALKAGRERLGTVAQELQQFLPACFELHHQTKMALDRARGPGWDPVISDLREQLSELFVPQFLTETPWPWLIQFPRYLQAIRQRLQRLESGGLRTELQLLSQFTPFRQRWVERNRKNQKSGRHDPMLDHYRWMLEEFRVSLFAQKLGTAITVSGPKLDEQWERCGHDHF
ncbi:MAG: ATP-dependent RNA helicase HrpA, partial [Planctomycetaceae bacterium]|nr:ATP-dependent RNA helicase HrpA [Planctomycetaceae bacterium]